MGEEKSEAVDFLKPDAETQVHLIVFCKLYGESVQGLRNVHLRVLRRSACAKMLRVALIAASLSL